jgi:hypothetical protein
MNLKECRLYRMKNHDYYVFIQPLILISYRNLLVKEIWDALLEINQFFKDVC